MFASQADEVRAGFGQRAGLHAAAPATATWLLSTGLLRVGLASPQRTAFEARRARKLAQDELLTVELERRKNEEESKRRQIQRICEQDEGLRELQELLKVCAGARGVLEAAARAQRLARARCLLRPATRHQQAYANKELAVQKQERAAAEAAARDEDAALDAVMEERRVASLEAERAEALRKAEEKRRLGAKVKEQIEEQEYTRFIEAELDAERSKAQVAAIVAQVEAQDAAERDSRQRAREEARSLMSAFQAERAAFVDRQRAAEREEEAQHRAYVEAAGRREEAVRASKAADLAAKEAAYRKIVEEQNALRAAQDEEDKLRWLVVEEEAEAAARADRAAREAATVKAREEMRTANAAQTRIREETEAAEKAREAELVRQFMEHCKEQEAKEQAQRDAAAARRAQFREDVVSQQHERRRLYEHQRAAEEAEAAEAAAMEAYRARVVAEARRKLLEEHGAMLEGYLPKGVFKSEEDLAVVRAARERQAAAAAAAAAAPAPAAAARRPVHSSAPFATE